MRQQESLFCGTVECDNISSFLISDLGDLRGASSWKRTDSGNRADGNSTCKEQGHINKVLFYRIIRVGYSCQLTSEHPFNRSARDAVYFNSEVQRSSHHYWSKKQATGCEFAGRGKEGREDVIKVS